MIRNRVLPLAGRLPAAAMDEGSRFMRPLRLAPALGGITPAVAR
jgi:hypothetical protein